MAVIHLMEASPFVAEAMLPKPALANGLFIFMLAAGKNGGPLFGGKTGGERPLDMAPPAGKIRVARR